MGRVFGIRMAMGLSPPTPPQRGPLATRPGARLLQLAFRLHNLRGSQCPRTRLQPTRAAASTSSTTTHACPLRLYHNPRPQLKMSELFSLVPLQFPLAGLILCVWLMVIEGKREGQTQSTRASRVANKEGPGAWCAMYDRTIRGD